VSPLIVYVLDPIAVNEILLRPASRWNLAARTISIAPGAEPPERLPVQLAKVDPKAEKIGAKPVYVPFTSGPAGFSLDIERLAAAITPRTRTIFINTPANPTGFVASHDDLRAVLALARKHGLWIVADEI